MLTLPGRYEDSDASDVGEEEEASSSEEEDEQANGAEGICQEYLQVQLRALTNPSVIQPLLLPKSKKPLPPPKRN